MPTDSQTQQSPHSTAMKLAQLLLIPAIILTSGTIRAEESYPPHPDSVVQEGVPKGELIKGTFNAGQSSVFPGTEREYQIYLPAGFDKSKPAAFMVFQDGVLYNGPVVFDNLIAKKEIPPLVGVFIKPGVVPAANPDALPRFNRSYEYDSVSDTYSKFLINEFLPAIEAKHGIKLSTDPNDAAIAGNSSGGIGAFMTCWHRPDRFRRIFSGVGTYVGIRGADQLSVLVRKTEPKPLRVYLQSGENDNNLYCGDWWMANQMMERSLTWAGYDVNHTWGNGGHNQKQATAIFPDVLRWLWRDYSTAKEIKTNPRGDSKWRGYEAMGVGEWEKIQWPKEDQPPREVYLSHVTSNNKGEVFILRDFFKGADAWKIDLAGIIKPILRPTPGLEALVAGPTDILCYAINDYGHQGQSGTFMIERLKSNGALDIPWTSHSDPVEEIVLLNNGMAFTLYSYSICKWEKGKAMEVGPQTGDESRGIQPSRLAVSPDQTQLFASANNSPFIASFAIKPDGSLTNWQNYYMLETNETGNQETVNLDVGGMCVDTEGRLYVATSLGIQVCDQAGRVNFIIPTPQKPYDVCLGGKDLGELFIACGDKIYKRQTKAHGYISGQMAPIKPMPPKL